MASRRTKTALVIASLCVAVSNANLAFGAELPFTILDRQEFYGSSGSMCVNPGAPPGEMQCIATADHRLLGQRLLLDFGRPVALSGFANLAPQTWEEYQAEPGDGSVQYDPNTGALHAESNEQETLVALSAPEWSLDHVLSVITVTELNDAGLHAEFPAVVARYFVWRVDATYENRREGTSFWSTVSSAPNGRLSGLRFYGEPVAVPEPSGFVLLVVGGGLFLRFRRAT